MFHFFVDPAFRNFGIVVYDRAADSFIEALCISPSPEYDAMRKRGVTAADIFHLQELTRALMRLHGKYPAVAVHIETPAGSKSGRASKLLASVLTVIVTWTEVHGVPLHLYSRAEAKKSILGISGGRGGKQKSELKRMVKNIVTRRWSQLRKICAIRTMNESEHICDAAALIFAARTKGNL